MIKVNDLVRYTKAKELILYKEFEYNQDDIIDVRIGIKTMDEISPIRITIGYEYNKTSFVWFKISLFTLDIEISNDIDKIFNSIQNEYVSFSHFYNVNTGKSRKGGLTGLNLGYKIKEFLKFNPEK